MIEEIPVAFPCKGNTLISIIHLSKAPTKIGVLIIVGGPQYRVGSHRQFVLLARMLANNGVPVMRFDYRGMGDSEGDPRTFSSIDDDVAAAINKFYEVCPELSGVVIWGLCDAASAALFYAYQDERVKGLVLLNPWVYTERGEASAYLKHYYLQRLTNPDFWHKIISFKFNYRASFASLLSIVRKKLSRPPGSNAIQNLDKYNKANEIKVDSNLALPIRMRECLRRFKHPVLIILSGKDLTADQFRDTVDSDGGWKSLMTESRLTRIDFPEADHTFSSQVWRDQVADWTLQWLKGLDTAEAKSTTSL